MDQTAASSTRVFSGHPTREVRARYAIGATTTVHLPDGKLMVAQVDVSNGHSGKRGPELHFGLGKLSGPATVPVDLCWRDVDGAIHRETFNLTPGLHTLLLGSGSFPEN